MSTYRCPACGAAHKEAILQCRLCGATMGSDDPLELARQRPDTATYDRYRPRGMGPAILLGLGLVVVILGIAIGTGTIKNSDQIDWVRDKIPFLKQNPDDGWIEFADADGVLVAETPGEPSVDDDGFAITSAGTVRRNVVAIGDDLVLTLGYTSGAGVSDDPDNSADTLEELAATFVAENEGQELEISEPFSYRGRPAIDVSVDGFRGPDGPGFANVRIILVDGEVVFAETISSEYNPEQHRRLANSVVLLVDDPGAAPTTAALTERDKELVDAFIAAEDIPAGTTATQAESSGRVVVDQVPRSEKPADAIGTIEEIADQSATEDIPAGTVINRNQWR